MEQINGIIKDNIFVGDMGIKTIAVGSKVIYERPGGYFYLKLTSEERRDT